MDSDKRIVMEVLLESKIVDFERLVELEDLPNMPRYTVKEVLDVLKNIKEGKIC